MNDIPTAIIATNGTARAIRERRYLKGSFETISGVLAGDAAAICTGGAAAADGGCMLEAGWGVGNRTSGALASALDKTAGVARGAGAGAALTSVAGAGLGASTASGAGFAIWIGVAGAAAGGTGALPADSGSGTFTVSAFGAGPATGAGG